MDEKTVYPWERKTKEKPMEITVMHNAWNEHGTWMGVKKNMICFTPGWTYELIPESKYPEMPIEDGVYRVRTGTPGNPFEHFLEMKNGEWLYPNGAKRVQTKTDGTIIEKYQRVK